MKIEDILELKFPVDIFNGNIILQDDGQGAYIKVWNEAVLGPRPTQVDLDRWELDIIPIQQAISQRQNRRNEYPPIGDQLDMLYKAMDSGLLTKVPEFYDSIKAVKDKYPLVTK